MGTGSPWEGIKREFEAARLQARFSAARELNEILRRFRHYSGESEWVSIVLDAVQVFTSKAAVFELAKDRLELRGERELSLGECFTLEPPLPHAFATAISSRDTTIAIRTPAEVGEKLSLAGAGHRAVIAPIVNVTRVVAILFAPDSAEPEGMELIAGMAGLVLERRSNAEAAIQIAAAAQKPESKPASNTAPALPPWSHLSEAERTRHIRAQRFARTRIAEMLLAHPEAARAGREQNNVYLFLRNSVDAAREGYRAQFLDNNLEIDYLHLELVRAAADGDEATLGADYPGPMA